MRIDNLKYNKMFEEYTKGGKFADYVNRCCKNYETNVVEELNKAITWEYFKSVTEGCNK